MIKNALKNNERQVDRVILIGGSIYPPSQVIEEYVQTNKNWIKFGDLNVGDRSNFGIVQVQDKFLILGGVDSNVVTNVVESLNLTSGVLTKLQPMTFSRQYPQAAVLNDYVYVFGGPNTSVERYDLSNNIWNEMPSLSVNRRACGVAVLNDEIYLVGGWINDSSSSLVEAFNPITKTWRTCSSMSVPRMWPGVTAFGGNLYAIGGKKLDTSPSERYTSVERYDPNSDKWTFVASLGMARYGITVFSNFYNGTLLAIGGSDGNSLMSEMIVEEYDVARDIWREIGPLNNGREKAYVFSVSLEMIKD
ncbi:uncharacterized protein LOC143915254 [Arctopsyche grandis]|uniref:uncharacterized protein LOC143915254 n=1 Tax=Arctopsyche grandis TaxID=121162 RepID=UPI00406D9346